MSITLPPRPESAVKLHGKRGKQLSPEAMSFYTEEELRARDLEVARLALKAAAGLVDGNAAYCSGQTAAILGSNADAIRKMEVRHHE